MKKENIYELKKKYLRREVLIICNDGYYHKRGKVVDIKDGIFPALVIIFNGREKYFHLHEILLVH